MTFTDGDALNAYAEEVSALRTRLAEVEAERDEQRALKEDWRVAHDEQKARSDRANALIAQLREALGEYFQRHKDSSTAFDGTPNDCQCSTCYVARSLLFSSPASSEPTEKFRHHGGQKSCRECPHGVVDEAEVCGGGRHCVCRPASSEPHVHVYELGWCRECGAAPASSEPSKDQIREGEVT